MISATGERCAKHITETDDRPLRYTTIEKILNIQFEQIVREMTGRMRTILVQTTL